LGSAWDIARTLRGFSSAMIVNTALAVFFFYFLPAFGLTPKTILFLQLAIFVSLFLVWRILYGEILRRIGAAGNLVLVGTRSASLELARNIVDHPELGYNIVALFNLDGGKIPRWATESGILAGDNLSQLKKIVRQGEVDTVIVSNELYPEIFSSLSKLLPAGVDFYNLSGFWEELNRSLPISEMDEPRFLESLGGTRKQFYETRKRFLDILSALFLGFFLLIFTPFVAFGIRLNSSGPIFYRQKRVGKGGKVFEAFKFRTMIADAERNGARWAKKNDSRVTKFGRLLRITRIDELPQLINVLRGEMSLIGPRPERPEFVKKLEKQIPHYGLRHIVRPGLTGWAQVNYPYGASIKDASRKLRYDLYYLKHRSLVLDAEIILKTIKVVVGREGQ
jgi:exopolysaccharide biosynthesis polyprenyl glycosylphosphotransferase